jgi:uncharacterized protein (TIGR03000 family)
LNLSSFAPPLHNPLLFGYTRAWRIAPTYPAGYMSTTGYPYSTGYMSYGQGGYGGGGYSGAPQMTAYPPASGQSYSAAYPSSTAAASTAPAGANSAVVTVKVPLALADVTFAGQRSSQTGTTRVFVTPALEADKTYTFTLQGNWTEGGEPKLVVRQVQVTAGQAVTVDLTRDS